jgi:uncharacterized membrane protein
VSLIKNIRELLEAEVIDQQTAERIETYFRNKKAESGNRLFIVFGVLGALLTGLGIILIIAHNWDELSRTVKAMFAFLPLLIGQGVCLYVLLAKPNATAWKESGTTFLFLSVGACISLVSQIYHIPGDLRTFLFTWMLLCLPLIYLMQSSLASLLYIIGITWYASLMGYFTFQSATAPYLYWLMILGVLPFYYLLYRRSPNSNFIVFHHWLIPISLTIALGTIGKSDDEILFVGYMSLFGFFYLLGSLDYFADKPAIVNGYKVLGALGTLSILMSLSFDWFWQEQRARHYDLAETIIAPEFLAAALLSILAGGLLFHIIRVRALGNIPPIAPVFLFFIIVFVIGLYSSASVVLINLCVFIIGLLIIRDGAGKDHLGILNFGLLVITVLIICRFFDTDLTFVVRGVLFVTVGIGFFLTNNWMLKKRKANA